MDRARASGAMVGAAWIRPSFVQNRTADRRRIPISHARPGWFGSLVERTFSRSCRARAPGARWRVGRFGWKAQGTRVGNEGYAGGSRRQNSPDGVSGDLRVRNFARSASSWMDQFVRAVGGVSGDDLIDGATELSICMPCARLAHGSNRSSEE